MAHRLMISAPGGGKTMTLVMWALGWAALNDRSVWFDDYHGSAARLLIAHLVARGMERRVVFERARWVDRVLGARMTVPSALEHPELRRQDELLRREWWLQPAYASGDLPDGAKNPWIKQYLDAAAGVFFSQPVIRRIDDVQAIFRRDDPLGQRMIAEATDRRAAWAFEDLFARSEGRNRQVWASEAGGSMRKLSWADLPTVYLRDGGNLDYADAMRRRLIVIRDLSGVPLEAARALVTTAQNGVVHAAREHFEATGRALPHGHVIDEAGVLGIPPLLLANLQEARKWLEPGGFTLASQSFDDFGDRIGKLLGYCSEHYYGYLGSGMGMAADDLCGAYQPRQVLDERERLIQDGWEAVPDVRTTDGPLGAGSSEGVRLLPRHRTVIDRTYSDPNRQRAELLRDLATNAPGTFHVRDFAGVRRVTMPPLPAPFALGLTEIRTDKAIERLRNHPLLSEPRSWTEPTSPAASRPAPTPAPATPSAARGMARSSTSPARGRSGPTRW